MDDEKTISPDAGLIDVNGISHFSAGIHMQLNEVLCSLVEEAGAELLHLPDGLIPRWKAAIDAEIGGAKGRKSSLLTKQLAEIDKERVKMLVSLFGVIRGNRHTPNEARRKAAAQLEVKLSRHRRTRRSISAQERSADIESIEMHLAELSAEIAALDLKETIDHLHELNERFRKLTAERRSEALKRQRPPMAEIRPHTDAAYAMVRRYVEASYLFAKTDEERTRIYRLVRDMNRVMAEYRANHRESRTKRRLAKLGREAMQDEAATENEATEGEA